MPLTDHITYTDGELLIGKGKLRALGPREGDDGFVKVAESKDVEAARTDSEHERGSILVLNLVTLHGKLSEKENINKQM